MDKYEYIVNLAEKTAKRVSQNRESWMKFLTSAARIYKYPFKEQLLIYAQNPDATACASIEIWNKRMNCWVNKGSSGIALPDDTATYGHKLKYVFDVSNVHAVKPNGRYPKAWKLREEHKSDVLHRLEQIYGSTDSTKPFEERILDIQVSRLRLLKANYTSQKYRMEDNIVQHYPRQIVMVKELIEKLEQDIALYEQNAATSKDKFHMQVGSGVYDTRKDAGNAIIKFFQTDVDGTAKIGTYLGFSMNIAFDSFNRKFVLRLKGAMNHPVEIGPDPVGNIIRLNNVLKTMPDKLAEAKDRLETLTNQLESAKIEVTKPFQQEEELAEKLKRLAELNALLNMDEKGTDALILEDDEQPAIVNSDMAVTPITSVKTKPMLKKKVVGLCL